MSGGEDSEWTIYIYNIFELVNVLIACSLIGVSGENTSFAGWHGFIGLMLEQVFCHWTISYPPALGMNSFPSRRRKRRATTWTNVFARCWVIACQAWTALSNRQTFLVFWISNGSSGLGCGLVFLKDLNWTMMEAPGPPSWGHKFRVKTQRFETGFQCPLGEHIDTSPSRRVYNWRVLLWSMRGKLISQAIIFFV